jgi:hypothetical protein
MIEKIYIHMIDGTDIWIPVEAEKLNHNEYLIGSFSDFDPEDASVIPQFIPGDIVSVELKQDKASDGVNVAKSLVRASSHKDKKYFNLLYRILVNNKPKDKIEIMEYKGELLKVKSEIGAGKFHYSAIVDYVKDVGSV